MSPLKHCCHLTHTHIHIHKHTAARAWAPPTGENAVWRHSWTGRRKQLCVSVHVWSSVCFWYRVDTHVSPVAFRPRLKKTDFCLGHDTELMFTNQLDKSCVVSQTTCLFGWLDHVTCGRVHLKRRSQQTPGGGEIS